jgi:hypothetical protein
MSLASDPGNTSAAMSILSTVPLYWGFVVARGGVEPPTFRFSVGRSYQLSYLARLAHVTRRAARAARGFHMRPYMETPRSAARRCGAVLTGLEPATSALTGRRALQLLHRTLLYCCAPNGIRTRATALKGRRPGPLDDEGGPAIIAHAHSDHGCSHPAPPEACKAYVTPRTIAKPHSRYRRWSLEGGCGERDRQHSRQPRRVRGGSNHL